MAQTQMILLSTRCNKEHLSIPGVDVGPAAASKRTTLVPQQATPEGTSLTSSLTPETGTSGQYLNGMAPHRRQQNSNQTNVTVSADRTRAYERDADLTSIADHETTSVGLSAVTTILQETTSLTDTTAFQEPTSAKTTIVQGTTSATSPPTGPGTLSVTTVEKTPGLEITSPDGSTTSLGTNASDETSVSYRSVSSTGATTGMESQEINANISTTAMLASTEAASALSGSNVTQTAATPSSANGSSLAESGEQSSPYFVTSTERNAEANATYSMVSSYMASTMAPPRLRPSLGILNRTKFTQTVQEDPDKRVSAICIGVVGIVFLLAATALILAFDILSCLGNKPYRKLGKAAKKK